MLSVRIHVLIQAFAPINHSGLSTTDADVWQITRVFTLRCKKSVHGSHSLVVR